MQFQSFNPIGSKKSIKTSKLSIKRSKILKLIKKVNTFLLFQSYLNNFNIKLISFDPIQTFRLNFELLESILSRRFEFERRIWIKKIIKS